MNATAPRPAVLRALRQDDLDTLAAIDAEVNPSPWSARSFRESMQSSLGFVAESPGGETEGFVLLRIVADEAEILNIAVRPAAQRRGLGSHLLAAALDIAQTRGANGCWLEVRESNRAAQSLYERHGFVESGRRDGYYGDGARCEDALLLCRDLP